MFMRAPAASATRDAAAPNVRAALVVTAVSCVLLAIISILIPQGLYTDPSWQLKALQQWRAGQSSNLNRLVQPDPAELSQDKGDWISWWPLSVSVLAAPLLALGLSVASAIRILSLTGLVVGAFGWTLWSSKLLSHKFLLPALAGLFPFLHYAVQPLFFFSTESFVFAAVPWVLLAVIRVHKSNSMPMQLIAGIFAGGLYFLKYSTVFVTIGCCLFLFLRTRGRARAVAGIGASLPILAVTLLNRHMGAAGNLVLASVSVHFSWPAVLGAFGNPSLIVADLDATLRRLLFFPSHRLLNSELWLPAIGLPGSLWLDWLIMSKKTESEAAALAATVSCSGVVALLATWMVSSGASLEARHLAGCTLPLLPFVISEVNERRRFAHMLMLSIFVVAPLGYGPITLPAKVFRQKRVIPGPSGVYNPTLANSDVRLVLSFLGSIYNRNSDVWYIPDPVSSLDIPARAVIRSAAFTDLSHLEAERFLNRQPMRVLLLLSSDLEKSGRGDLIRHSFVNAERWTAISIPDSPYRLWISTLRPN